MKKMQKKKAAGGNWMDTYGDMVTLLLCFFVLLYSISTVDTVKWKNFVKSLNPDAEDVTQIVQDTDIPPGDEDVPGNTDDIPDSEMERINADFNQLYEMLEKLAIDSDGDIVVTHGIDFVFVMFQDKVFFDGDSHYIRPDGRKVLDRFAKIIDPLSKSIKEMQIMGHTTQALPNKKNPIESDRTLSAMRAAKVTIYLQSKGIIAASKLVSLGYGQHHPVASFETEPERMKNRRVEIMITKKGGVVKSIDDYYAEVEKAQAIEAAAQNQEADKQKEEISQQPVAEEAAKPTGTTAKKAGGGKADISNETEEE